MSGVGGWINRNILGGENKATAQTVPIQEEAYEYGGRYGGADEAANRYKQQGQAAQGREAAQANYGAAIHAGLNPGMQARGDMNQVGQAQLARALGRVPSIAQMQADRQMGQASAQQAALQASARGRGALANASTTAANNTANAHGAISNQAQINAAQERMAAEQAAAGTFGNMGALDAQRMKQLADMSQYQATNQMQQRELNDRMQLGMTGYETGVRGMQLGAAQNREAQYSSNYYNAAGINAGVGGQNAAAAGQAGYGAVSMIPALAGAAAGAGGGGGSVTGKADGGPVQASQPYLVGERGPELIVPKRDAVVIPAGQTEGLLSRALGQDRTQMRDGPSDPRTYNMERSFHRDTPQDQANVRRQVEDQASREADAMMAGYMAALKQGAAAGPTAEVDVDRDAPAPWLAQYMEQQAPQLAARADGGPLQQGQPGLVGEQGPELVVPQMATWGRGTSVEGVGETTRDQYANEASRVQAEANEAAKVESPWERDVRRHNALRSMGDREGAAMVAPGAGRARAVLRGAKQAQGSAPEAEAKEDPAEKQAVAEGKQAPPSLRSRLGGAVGSVGDGAMKLASGIDTRYHGPTSFQGPQLIPVMAPPRAMGGPMMGGSPYTVGERGPEMVVPMGMNPGGPTQMSGGGMDVLGSLRAHSNFATQFQRNPAGQAMASPVAREEGGPVAQGQTALVGEKGPEMVVPQVSLLSRLGDSLRSAIGMAPQTTTAPAAPRVPRHAEISSGAPLTTKTNDPGTSRVTLAVGSHGYVPEKAPRLAKDQEPEHATLAQRANREEDAEDERRRKQAQQGSKK